MHTAADPGVLAATRRVGIRISWISEEKTDVEGANRKKGGEAETSAN
jgi:hypothetical protein